jgi:hypothetical protein
VTNPRPLSRITTQPGSNALNLGVTLPRYAAGGQVSQLAPPKPPGADDGCAALKRSEFVVKEPEAQQYAGVLQQINDGTYDPGDHPMSGHDNGPASILGSSFASPGDGQEPEGDPIEVDPTTPTARVMSPTATPPRRR